MREKERQEGEGKEKEKEFAKMNRRSGERKELREKERQEVGRKRGNLKKGTGED